MVYVHVCMGGLQIRVTKRVFTQAKRPGEISLHRLKDQGGEFMDAEGSGEVIPCRLCWNKILILP